MISRLRSLAPWVVVLLFGLALVALRHQLRAHPYSEISEQVHAIPSARLLAALVLTFLSYAALSGYDVLALRVIGNPLPFPRAMLAGSAAGAFSNSLAFANLSGSAVRYRFYSAWGMEAGDVGRLAVLVAVTMWVGVTALGGAAFFLHPLPLPDFLHLPWANTRPLGVLGLVLLAIYLVAVLRKKPIRIRGFEIPLPTLPQALALATHELMRKKPLLDRLGRLLDAGGALVPNALSVLVFASGVVLLVSGATPAERVQSRVETPAWARAWGRVGRGISKPRIRIGRFRLTATR